MKSILIGAALAGFAVLGCESSDSQSAEPSSYLGTRDTQVRVEAPDGRTFFGPPVTVKILPSVGFAETFTFVMTAGLGYGTDPAGRLQVGIDQPVEKVVNPELLELPISPPPASGGGFIIHEEGAVVVENESAQMASGRVHFELRAGRVTGWVEAPVGTYAIDGLYLLECLKPMGDTAATADESFATPLCQRFASLRKAE